MITFRELKRKNENNLINNSGVFYLSEYFNKLYLSTDIFIVDKDGLPIYTLDDLEYYLNKGIYIKNINFLNGKITRFKSVPIGISEWYKITGGLQFCKNVQFRIVDNLSMFVSKYSLLGYTAIEIKGKSCYILVKDNDGLVVSSYYLQLNPSYTYKFVDMYFENLYIDNLDMSRLKSMTAMFSDSANAVNIKLVHFNTVNVESINGMFFNCIELKTVSIEDMITRKVVDSRNMFADCVKLQNLDLCNFDMSNCMYMGAMFKNCKCLEMLNIETWKTPRLVDMHMFLFNCQSLRKVDMSGVFSNINKNNVNTYNWLYGCSPKIYIKNK